MDERHVRCTGCAIRILKHNYERHATRCKGVRTDQCMYCHKRFESRSGKSKHQKKCGRTHRSTTEEAPPVGTTTTGGAPNVYHILMMNVTNHFNLHFDFGEENVGYILDHQDPRYTSLTKSLKDSMDLVHFNEDHPENHTVRKLNKKSDLMEFRTKTADGDDRWEQHDCSTGIPRLRSNLETKLNTKFEDDTALSNPTLRELLYHKSKRGNLSEEDILTGHNDLARVRERRCKAACDAIVLNFLKHTGVNIQKTPCVVRCLQHELNETRRTYDQPELTLGEVLARI